MTEEQKYVMIPIQDRLTGDRSMGRFFTRFVRDFHELKGSHESVPLVNLVTKAEERFGFNPYELVDERDARKMRQGMPEEFEFYAVTNENQIDLSRKLV